MSLDADYIVDRRRCGASSPSGAFFRRRARGAGGGGGRHGDAIAERLHEHRNALYRARSRSRA